MTVCAEWLVDSGKEPFTALQSISSALFHPGHVASVLELCWENSLCDDCAFSPVALQLHFNFFTNLFLYLSYVSLKFLYLLDIDPIPPDCPQPRALFLFLNFLSFQ